MHTIYRIRSVSMDSGCPMHSLILSLVEMSETNIELIS